MNNLENTEVEEIEIELPFTITLSKPIEYNSGAGRNIKEITEITFQNDLDAGMVGHFRPNADGTLPLSDFYPVISKMTGELEKTIKKLAYKDFLAAIDVVSYFLGDGPSTGGNQ